MIKIETEKVVVRGVQKRRIIKIEALSETELPFEYVQGSPFVRLGGSNGKSLLITKDGNTTKWMDINELWDEEVFQKWLKVIKAAGDRLRDINKKLEKKNKDWHGEETFLV